MKRLEALSSKNQARSGFAGLAGLDDRFESGQDLRDTTRGHMTEFDKSDSIPVIETKDAMGKDIRLNAYVIVEFLLFISVIKAYVPNVK